MNNKKRIRISREVVSKLFANGLYRIERGFDEEHTLVGFRYDETTDTFWFVFDTNETVEAATTEEICPTFTKVDMA